MRASSDRPSERTTEIRRAAPAPRSAGATLLKRTLQAIALCALLPRLALYGAATLVLGKERAFANASEGVGRIPGLRGLYLRQAFYRSTLEECGRDVYFGWLCAFATPAARIGEGVYIGRRCGLGLVTLGANAMLADGVQVLSGARQHGTEPSIPYREQPQTYRRVAIGAGAWLGAGAVVMADVGEGAIVGAGAVVNRRVAARCVAAGVPAKVVRQAAEQSPPKR